MDLGELKLPYDLEKEAEGRIQKAVLQVLADIDFRGDQRINPFPPGLFGIVPPDFPDFPELSFPTRHGSSGPILSKEEITDISSFDKISVAREHTRIVRAIMERPLLVIRNLRSKSPGPLRASRTEILNAARQATSFDKRMSSRINICAKLLPEIGSALQRIPPATRDALDEVIKELSAAPSVDEIISRLSAMRKSGKYDNHDGLSVGIEIAMEAMQDGRDTIYSPDFTFYKLFQDNPDGSNPPSSIAASIGGADAGGLVGGAVAGALAGSIVPGAGTVAGAVSGGLIGGISGSAGEAISELWDAIFD